jgi:hypothetical protein
MYFETLVGRVVGMALKVAGPERAMKREALSFSPLLLSLGTRPRYAST